MDERIEEYFQKQLSDAAKARLEADLKSDPALADDVAFYLVTKSAATIDARDKKLSERHAEWKSVRPKQHSGFTTLRTWYAVAAAVAFIAFGLAWYVLAPAKRDMQQLANGYVMENFTTLSVQMGGGEDSIQLALNSYNTGQYATASKVCKQILARDPENAEAKKIAGIVSLKLLDYDKAVSYFHQLGEQKGLYANPGKFYEAIALLKSGIPENSVKARELLKEVIHENLEGKEEAVKWMD
jgi:tetratricopeptide (TPR) repeat protein